MRPAPGIHLWPTRVCAHTQIHSHIHKDISFPRIACHPMLVSETSGWFSGHDVAGLKDSVLSVDTDRFALKNTLPRLQSHYRYKMLFFWSGSLLFPN